MVSARASRIAASLLATGVALAGAPGTARAEVMPPPVPPFPSGVTLPAPQWTGTATGQTLNLVAANPAVQLYSTYACASGPAIDSAAPVLPFADFVPYSKGLTTHCDGVVDVEYWNDNQTGVSAAAVAAGGSGYAANEILTFDPTAASFSGTISGTTLTIATAVTGTLTPGERLVGAGVPAGTTLVAAIDATHYTLSQSATAAAPTAMTARYFIEPAQLQVTQSGGAVTAAAVYAAGGRGRTAVPGLIAALNPIAQTSTSGSGAGATFTLTTQSNFPTGSIGEGATQAALQNGKTPYTLSINPPNEYPEYGGLAFKVNDVSTGPLWSVTHGATHWVDMTQAGLLQMRQNGSAAAPLISLGAGQVNSGLYGDGVGNLYAAISGTQKAALTSTQLTLAAGVSVDAPGGYFINGSQVLVNAGSFTEIFGNSSAHIIVGSSGNNFYGGGAHTLRSADGATVFNQFDANGAKIGNQSSAWATSAAGPFWYIPTGAGAPTGVPTNHAAGRSALYIDSTNHKICWYEDAASAWKCAAGS